MSTSAKITHLPVATCSSGRHHFSLAPDFWGNGESVDNNGDRESEDGLASLAPKDCPWELGCPETAPIVTNYCRKYFRMIV